MIFTLLMASIQASLNILALTLGGVYLKRRDIINDDTTKKLSGVLVQLLVPSLMFSKITSTLTLENFLSYWLLIVFPLAYVFLGLALGYIIARFILRCDERMYPLIMTCAAFSNNTSLPLAVIFSLTDIAVLKQTPDDTDDDIHSRGASYVLIYSLVMTILRWVVAFPMLRDKEANQLEREMQISDERMLKVESFEFSDENESLSDEVEERQQEKTWLDKAKSISSLFLTPPIVCAAFSLVIAFIKPLRLLFQAHHPLNFILKASQMFGNAVVPITLIILGSKLSRGPQKLNQTLTPGVIATLVTFRLMIFPLIGLGMVLFGRYLSIIVDPALCFVLMLESAMPFAINLIVLCQLNEYMEKEIGNLLFYCYLPANLTMCLWIIVFLFALS